MTSQEQAKTAAAERTVKETGAAAALADGWELALSLSHDGGYAVAMVVAWRGE